MGRTRGPPGASISATLNSRPSTKASAKKGQPKRAWRAAISRGASRPATTEPASMPSEACSVSGLTMTRTPGGGASPAHQRGVGMPRRARSRLVRVLEAVRSRAAAEAPVKARPSRSIRRTGRCAREASPPTASTRLKTAAGAAAARRVSGRKSAPMSTTPAAYPRRRSAAATASAESSVSCSSGRPGTAAWITGTKGFRMAQAAAGSRRPRMPQRAAAASRMPPISQS